MATKPKEPKSIKVLTKKGVLFRKLFKNEKNLDQSIGSSIAIQTQEDMMDRVRLLHLSKEEICELEKKCSKNNWEIDIEWLVTAVHKIKGMLCEKNMVRCAKQLCDKLKLCLSQEKAQKLVVLAQSLSEKKDDAKLEKERKKFPYKNQRKMCCLAKSQNYLVPVIPSKLAKKYDYTDNVTIDNVIQSWQSIGGCDSYKKMSVEDLKKKLDDCKKNKKDKKDKAKLLRKQKCDSDSDSDSCSSSSDSDCSSDSDSDCDKKKKKKCDDSSSCSSSSTASCSTASSCSTSSSCSTDAKKEKDVECTESEAMLEILPCPSKGTKLVCEKRIDNRKFRMIWKNKDKDGFTSTKDMDRAFKVCRTDGGCTQTKAKELVKSCIKRRSRNC